jgi:aminocarboxymuconate-semialdehyde decarboxylase
MVSTEDRPVFFACAPRAPAERSGGAGRAPRRTGALTVDIHCHCNTPAAAKLMEGLKPPPSDRNRLRQNPLTRSIAAENTRREAIKHTDAELRLAEMDAMGIDVQAISTGPMQFYYWAEPDLCRQTSRLINDNLAGIAAAHPERFVALGTVPLQDTELAIAELERCVRDLGMHGVEICTNVNGEELASPRLDPFFARVEELEVMVFLHAFSYTESERFNDYNLANTIGHPLDNTVAISHFIFSGALERHPDLKLVFAHGGGYLPLYPGRADHAFRTRGDSRENISKEPSQYLRRLYFDTVVYDPIQLRTLIEMYGSDHILLGTDYPFDMGETDPLGLIGQVPALSEVDMAAIVGGNAIRLLGLDDQWVAAARRRLLPV